MRGTSRHSLTCQRVGPERVDAIDWPRVAQDLDARGSATVERLLTPDECEALAASYALDRPFRSRVVMARHGFGRGEYKYFSYPLPGIVQALRTALYPRLAPIANRWNEAMGIAVRYPGPACGVHRALPCRRPGPADAAAAEVRGGRLQLPASGRLRRARLPAAGHGAAVPAGPRLRRRRVRHHRAAAAHAVARRSGSAASGRCGDLRRAAIVPCRARAASIASTCATASAAYARATATR